MTPLLLQSAWSAQRSAREREPALATPESNAFLWRSPWLWAIVGVGLLSHPGAMLVGYSGSGLPGGAPLFISSDDCVAEPAPDRNVRVVVGYADSYTEARAMRRRAVSAGLADVDVAKDGCGRLRVFLDDIASADASRTLSVARDAELEPTLELDPDG